MLDLHQTLSRYDLELLKVIANRWDVDLGTRDPKIAVDKLVPAMRDPAKLSGVWARLDEKPRQTLQTLLGSGGKMASAMFNRLFGEIRVMGADKLAREKPYLNPQSDAEALYYHGLIAIGQDTGKTGVQPVIYIPTDLIPLMPTNRTGYDLRAPAPAAPIPPAGSSGKAEPGGVRLADTALVDDMTTFMAWCQTHPVTPVDNNGYVTIAPEAQQALKPYFIGQASTARIALLLALSADLGIGALQGDLWRMHPSAQTWFTQSRSDQARTLAEAWQKSVFYNDLLYVTQIKVETSAQAPNDPLLARQAVVTFLELVPGDEWWSLDELIAEIKENEADFQRPAGNYNTWYIRDAQTNTYLNGFESWDKVEGNLLRFILLGVMNSLGLLDTAERGSLCRLTAYGRAFIGQGEWPRKSDDPVTLVIRKDGSTDLPREANRYTRFQLARFSEWISAGSGSGGGSGSPYTYRITAASLGMAREQQFVPDQVGAFLRQISADNVPEPVLRLIATWGQSRAQSATLERLIVLQTPTAELLRTIESTPDLRRYLSTPLGPNAVAVRADQWAALFTALQEHGIPIESDVE